MGSARGGTADRQQGGGKNGGDRKYNRAEGVAEVTNNAVLVWDGWKGGRA